MTNQTQTADLDTTIALLKNGLASIDPEAAIANIEAWQQQLQGTEIAETLGELKLAIDNGVRSGEIPGILAHLGNQAASAAASQEGSSASKLQELGQLLSKTTK